MSLCFEQDLGQNSLLSYLVLDGPIPVKLSIHALALKGPDKSEPAHALHCQFKANILACSSVAAVPWINCSICFWVPLFPGEESNLSVIACVLERPNWYLARGMLDVFSCACILWRTRILPGRTGTVGRVEALIPKPGKNRSAGWCSVVVASSHRIDCLWSASASKKNEEKRGWDQGNANFFISHFSGSDEFMFWAGSRTEFFAIMLCSRWSDPVELSIHVLALKGPHISKQKDGLSHLYPHIVLDFWKFWNASRCKDPHQWTQEPPKKRQRADVWRLSFGGQLHGTFSVLKASNVWWVSTLSI